ncbi:uncharacterized protein (TIGR00369 family) [Humitalea rosea]|uniref:Uncharacterized protein (TIGR00369 family) n=1 Tax=Humitalea rosea TaxID=990373 RepID=A0A2W7IP11_9PROT|nr:PaaI family thioesterase [Humitalea rosea]PZW47108.1 uncharacterized protein (TIGR00369 family) [Humitalea rosea]
MLHEDPAHSPFHDLLGLTLVDWEQGFARMACEVGPQHFNRSGIAHGGLILSLIDQAAAFSGLHCTVPGNLRRAVTVDLDCRFTGQITAGRVTAEGRIVTAGRSLFFCRTEVLDAAGKVVAFGASTHKWRKGSENPEGVAP